MIKKVTKNVLTYIVVILMSVSTSMFGQDIPKHNGTLVNDFANIIPDDQEATLRTLIKDYENKTSIQMCVVTISSLEGQNIEEYANTLFRTWGIGQKGLNNGLLVLVAPNERKWKIEVGYGLEEWITDAYSKSVGELNFKPNFRKGDYYTGIKNALTNFMSTLGQDGWAQRQEFIALEKKKHDEELHVFLGWMFGIIFVALIGILSILFYYRNKRNEERARQLAIEKENIRKQQEELRIQNERKRLAKIQSAKDTQVILKKEFDFTKNKLDTLENKKFIRYNTLLQLLQKSDTDIDSVVQLNSETDTDLILSEHARISKNLNDISNEIKENKDITSDINSSYNNCSTLVTDIKMTMTGVESMLKKLHDDYSSLSVDTEESNLRFKVERLLSNYEVGVKDSKSTLDAGDYKKAQQLHNDSKNILSNANALIKNASSIKEKVKSADSFVKRGTDTLSPLIILCEKLNKNSDVKSSTKTALLSSINEARNFNPQKYITNPLVGNSILINLINSVEKTISTAKNEIEYEENRRRRKREEEEEEQRRRRRREREEEEERLRAISVASSYSSSSSWSDNSSSSSSSSFGGGDSGGGGSSGDW